MTKFLFKFKKLHCWPIFGPFPQFLEQKKFFSPKSPTVMHNFIRVSRTMPKFKKSNDPIPRKHPDRQQNGRMDNPYFTGSFQLPTIRDLTSTTAVDWHLKKSKI